ncbi:transcriptional regulator [Balneolales bacterium ANBcel1]|nr:transcriptional regulator [Balneolales bacterium ANBcel1]
MQNDDVTVYTTLLMRRPKYIIFDYNKIDKLLHNRLRLALLSSVAYSEEIDFSTLKNTVKATDGNLGRQIQILEESGYLTTRIRHSEKRPQKMVTLTPKGRSALIRYKKHIMTLLQFQDSM